MSQLCGSQSWLQAAFQAAPGVWPFRGAGFSLRRASARISSASSMAGAQVQKPEKFAAPRERRPERPPAGKIACRTEAAFQAAPGVCLLAPIHAGFFAFVGHVSACPGEPSSPLGLPPGSNRASSGASVLGSAPKSPRASSRIESGRPRAGRQTPLPTPREAESRASFLDLRMESPLALGIVAEFRQAFERVMPGSNLPEFDVV